MVITLATCIEVLEADNQQLKSELAELGNMKIKPFGIDDVAGDDSLVRFYTGFISCEVLLVFFNTFAVPQYITLSIGDAGWPLAKEETGSTQTSSS